MIEDRFKGNNTHLARSIRALLALDDAGALAGVQLGGHARYVLSSAAVRLDSQVEVRMDKLQNEHLDAWLHGYTICEDCDGKGAVGQDPGDGWMQPPETIYCDSCGGSGRQLAETPKEQTATDVATAFGLNVKGYFEMLNSAGEVISLVSTKPLLARYRARLRGGPLEGAEAYVHPASGLHEAPDGARYYPTGLYENGVPVWYCGVVLDKSDTEFLAARLRRLFVHFNHEIPADAHKDDVYMVRIAAACIGQVLAKL